MKYRIIAIAPSRYQYQSLSNFGKPVKVGNGTYKFQKDFNTNDEAKKYLIECAESYLKDKSNIDLAVNCINRYDQLTLDAVTAYIKEI